MIRNKSSLGIATAVHRLKQVLGFGAEAKSAGSRATRHSRFPKVSMLKRPRRVRSGAATPFFRPIISTALHLSWSRIDQGQATFRIAPLTQMLGAFRHYDFKRRPHVRFEQMPGECGPVPPTKDDVRMQ